MKHRRSRRHGASPRWYVVTSQSENALARREELREKRRSRWRSYVPEEMAEATRDLYHYTDLESARSMVRDGVIRADDLSGDVLFSDRLNSQTSRSRYGTAVVLVQLPAELVWLESEDAGDPGERYWVARAEDVKAEHIKAVMVES